jgi:uncharacterized membrane protein YukC
MKQTKMYIKVKKWTIFRGILITLMLQLVMCIPIVNTILFFIFLKDNNENKEIGENIFYDYKEIEVLIRK